MASINTIICDLVDYYKDRAGWEAELDAKIEKFVGQVDGEEIVYSSINGQQFRWAETALQPSDWFSIYKRVKEGVSRIITPPDVLERGAGTTVSFSNLRV